MEKSLLCDEALLSSPPSSPETTSQPYQTQSISTATMCHAVADEDRDAYIRACVAKQHSFLPRGSYVERLRQCPELSDSRHRAVRWIIMVRLRLDLSFGTAFSAVNYLDRFVSLHDNMKWEGWMTELLSVACLSIAAKFDEVFVPSLHELPAEDLEHSFHPSAIQRMELAVLGALGWRLNCVTAHSFVGPLTWHAGSTYHPHLRRAFADRAVELLVGAALDVEFLAFSPCATALSALRCALEELAPSPETHRCLSLLSHLIPQEHMEEMEECHRSMEERVADPVHSLITTTAASGSPDAGPSPVTVITPERHGAAGCIVDVGVFLEMGVYLVDDGLLCDPKKKHRKTKGIEGLPDRRRCPPE